MKRLARITFAIRLATLACFSCNRNKEAAKPPSAQLPPGHEKAVEAYNKSVEESKKITVAKVNGAIITMNDLVGEMNAVAPQYLKEGQKRDAEFDKKVQKVALDRLINRELAIQEATKQGLQVPPQVVEEQWKKGKDALKTEQAYRDALARMGITEDQLKQKIRRDLLVEAITEKEIFAKVKVDPALVRKTYEKDKASYKGPNGKQLSFEEARPMIEDKLMTPLVRKREDAWVAGLKKAAKIEITMGESAKEIHSVK